MRAWKVCRFEGRSTKAADKCKELKGLTYDDIKNHLIIVSGTTLKRNDDGSYKRDGTNNGKTVDICAPSEHVLAAWCSDLDVKDKYGWFSGSSSATPLVAGAAALLWSCAPALSSAEVKECLVNGHVDRAVKWADKKITETYPMLNVGGALKYAAENFGVVLKAQNDEKKGSDADELLDKFIAGEIPAQDETDEFYVGDLADSWAEYTVGGRLDLDNDGENELIIEGHSGTSMYLDASDGKVRVFTRGGGMSNVLSHLSYDGAEWIVHSDTSHAGRKMYFLEKYNGADTVVDSFDLNAEYWNSSTDTYDENSTFTYRGKQITMEEYEKLIKEIFG